MSLFSSGSGIEPTTLVWLDLLYRQQVIELLNSESPELKNQRVIDWMKKNQTSLDPKKNQT